MQAQMQKERERKRERGRRTPPKKGKKKKGRREERGRRRGKRGRRRRRTERKGPRAREVSTGKDRYVPANREKRRHKPINPSPDPGGGLENPQKGPIYPCF